MEIGGRGGPWGWDSIPHPLSPLALKAAGPEAKGSFPARYGGDGGVSRVESSGSGSLQVAAEVTGKKSEFRLPSRPGNCLAPHTMREMYFIRRKGLNRPSGFFYYYYYYLFLLYLFFLLLPVGYGSQASASQRTADVTRCRGMRRQGWQGRWPRLAWTDLSTDGQRDEGGIGGSGLAADAPPAVSRRAAIHWQCPRTHVHGYYRHCRHASSGFMGHFDYSKG